MGTGEWAGEGAGSMGTGRVRWRGSRQVQRERACGRKRGGGDGVDVGHVGGVQGVGRAVRERGCGGDRGGAGWVGDGGGVVRAGGCVECEGSERGRWLVGEHDDERGELRDEKVRGGCESGRGEGDRAGGAGV